MRYLVSLDVSHNQLTSVLDFSPPLALRIRFKSLLVDSIVLTKGSHHVFYGFDMGGNNPDQSNITRTWVIPVGYPIPFPYVDQICAIVTGYGIKGGINFLGE